MASRFLPRKSRLKRQVAAGALIGAAAAVFVGALGQFLLWYNAGSRSLSTGATQGTDMLSYFSMARAVWRSPNGITYTYPYELYWPVPPVAFQLPITLLAWLGRLTGLPVAFEIGRVAGAAGAGAALGAMGALFPHGFWRRWFYIAAALGGGLFGLGAIYFALQTAGLPGLTEPHEYAITAEGRLLWWLPFLIRNLRMPLECIYHGLVMGGLACLVWRRYGWAWLLGLAAWMSNPFAAVALHAAAVPWLAWRAIESRGPQRVRFAGWLGAWLAVNIMAVIYYGWFLNRWPLMRELNRLYKIQYVPAVEWWRLILLVMPYGLALLSTALFPSMRRAIWGRPTWRLFALLALAHLVLLQQSLVLGQRSMQAYHYNRGYLQLGLVIVAWRVVILMINRAGCLRKAGDRWFPWQMPHGRCRQAAALIAIIVSITCLDQVFFAAYVLTKPTDSGLVSADFAKLVSRIPARPAPMIVLTEPYASASYVTAASPHVAYDALETMIVPFTELRSKLLDEATNGAHGGFAGLGIDYAITTESNLPRIAALESQGWFRVERIGSQLLYQSPRPHPGTSAPLPAGVNH